MMELRKVFGNKKERFSKDDIAHLLKTTPEALNAFESAYEAASFEEQEEKGFFGINSRQAVREILNGRKAEEKSEEIVSRITAELLGHPGAGTVSIEEVMQLPAEIRPQLTATAMKRDIVEPAYLMVLRMYMDAEKYRKSDPKRAVQGYHMFRQGLDILDLDPVLYEIIGMNRNSIGHWFPQLKAAVEKNTFFKVPETKIVKVPLPILQLTRQEYMQLTPATLEIVDRWAFEAFGLDENKTYFIKTGTYSSKFDFRNAKVTTPKEVRELGSYLLYIHFQALQMASPLCQPCIYGVSTTNEWCVREYIEDKENNPCIYHGMPLHTEYRVFIDCDAKEVLGISPYWRADIMRKRFSQEEDADTADMKHDYIIYTAHEETLMRRYKENKDAVLRHVQDLLPHLDLTGQWSLDVMQNGDDFWVIDMADAANSALADCVPAGKLKKAEEKWLPEFNGRE